ncbi:hypothetical protein BDV35DRAFT_346333 [Aspergillus flavus]|uniref:Uncharacterized protein n=1 Tax=Aspergillus flavus TaxID=5059 RepID=A0A5N6H2V4_ASPFL|nr:hypothetical protein BDV35DRAFT_346333 [Aspergillus flavus]
MLSNGGFLYHIKDKPAFLWGNKCLVLAFLCNLQLCFSYYLYVRAWFLDFSRMYHSQFRKLSVCSVHRR